MYAATMINGPRFDSESCSKAGCDRSSTISSYMSAWIRENQVSRGLSPGDERVRYCTDYHAGYTPRSSRALGDSLRNRCAIQGLQRLDKSTVTSLACAGASALGVSTIFIAKPALQVLFGRSSGNTGVTRSHCDRHCSRKARIARLVAHYCQICLHETTIILEILGRDCARLRPKMS